MSNLNLDQELLAVDYILPGHRACGYLPYINIFTTCKKSESPLLTLRMSGTVKQFIQEICQLFVKVIIK